MSEISLNAVDTDAIAVELGESERHELLASGRRRILLDIFDGRSTAVELDELAAGVAAREAEADATDEETVERIRTALHHVHLPKMDDAGVVDYDPSAHRIEP